ncbi:MAG: LLM class flavin-dependent oxidoreductase, partial [Dehalococcoidia bacterium]
FSNYGMSPAPLMQALHIGHHTKRIKIATAVVVLPIWDPLRLAEEVAVLDNLIDGRFIVGIGRGYQPHELSRFGVDLPDTRQMFNETLEVLVKAWTQDESFTYAGEKINVPNETTVWPKPLTKPHPPLWVAGTSVETMVMAAEWDMMPVTTGMMGEGGVSAHLASLVQATKSLGKPYHGLHLGLQSMTLVADTDEQAAKEIVYPRWQTRAGRALNRLDVTNGRVNPTPFEGEQDDAMFLDRLYFGSPDTIIKKFSRAASVGVTHVSNWMMMGGIPHEKVMRSIKFMGEEVIPALKDISPPDEIYEELASRPPVTAEELQAIRARGPAPSDVT